LAGSLCISVLAACGGPATGANSPSTCPAGTVLQGSDCLQPAGERDAGEAATPSSSSPNAASSGDATDHPSGDMTPYDREAVEAELKRAARSIKASCGAATDNDGQANGPWGATKASVTLGRNGHVKQVSVPAPYAGQPVGACAADAFKKIWFPPYAAPSDVTVEWDVEFVKPKK
jgi:hypothetical protein